jgi:hypothetical protein
MTGRFSTGIITRSRLAEEVGMVLDFLDLQNDPDQTTTLTQIMHLVDMQSGASSEGWNRETARLFAIDTAMVAAQRNMALISEADQQSVALLLQQAQALVIAGRHEELGSLQAALESHLAPTAPGRERQVWLTAIDALIPSAYRAALIVTKSALSLGATEALADLAQILRHRLQTRLTEGSLPLDEARPRYLTG